MKKIIMMVTCIVILSTVFVGHASVSAATKNKSNYTNVNYKGKVIAHTLNVRSGMGSKYKVIDQFKNGKIVQVTKKSNQWVYIKAGKTKGWAMIKYIKKAPVATSYQTLDIRFPSKVKASSINNYISKYESYTGKTSIFKGKGQLFINIGKETGINPLILASMAIHESAYGTNELSIQKFNLFSVGAYDEDPLYYAHIFQSVEHSIRYQAKFLKEGYLNPNNWKYKGTHLGNGSGGLNYYYATDKKWGEKIAAHANKIHPFTAQEHTSISLMVGTIPKVTSPIIPSPK